MTDVVVNAADVADLDELARLAGGQAVRGTDVVVTCEGVGWDAVLELAADLQRRLGEHLTAIAGPHGVRIRRLVGVEEIERHRAHVVRLIGDFRTLATDLVASARTAGVFDADGRGEAWDELTRCRDVDWQVWPHDPHCRFVEPIGGTVVDALVDDPGALDPGFLLEYARTAPGHEAVAELCRCGFSDMARILDVLGA